jgi:tetratricopeptide (TPR) repeat protein
MHATLGPLLLLLAPALTQDAREPDWHPGPLEVALADAGERATLALLYFRMDGSEHCRAMEATLAVPPIAAELHELVCLRVDAAAASGAPLLARFGVKTLPTVLLVEPGGEVQDAIIGSHGPEPLRAELVRIRRGESTVGSLRAALAESPADLDLRLALALKLHHVGALADYERELERIHERDPEGKTLPGARVALWDVMGTIAANTPDPAVSADYDLALMYAFLERATFPSVLLEGWEWVARVEAMRGDRRAARAALRAAWPHVAPGNRVSWAGRAAAGFCSYLEELGPDEKAFALELATHAVEEAQGNELMHRYLPGLLLTRARARAMNGRVEEALADVERALALDPELVGARELLDELRGEDA